MTRVLQEMESGGKVDQGLLTGAYTQMASLFQELTAISDQCKQQHLPPQRDILSMLGAVPLTAPPATSSASNEDVGMAISPLRPESSKNYGPSGVKGGA